MVAANGQGGHACGLQLVKKALNACQRVHEVHRIDRRVPQVGAVANRKRLDAIGPVDVAHHGGVVAHLARAVAGTCAVGGAAIPGHADQTDIHILEHRLVQAHQWQAHERGNAGKARHDRAGNGVETIVCHGVIFQQKKRGGAAALRLEQGARDHEAQNFKQHLRAGLGGVGGGVVLRRHFHHVAAANSKALEAVQYL